jgi:ribosomal protein S18 acetylase RimI-like enzyme
MKTFKQFINESEELYKHKLENLKDIHGDVHVRHRLDDLNGRHIYTVHHQGNKIASAKLSGQGDYVTDVDVKPEFRRKGVASKLYDFIEKHSGKKLNPSPMYQTGEGKAFWKNRK